MYIKGRGFNFLFVYIRLINRQALCLLLVAR